MTHSQFCFHNQEFLRAVIFQHPTNSMSNLGSSVSAQFSHVFVPIAIAIAGS